MGVLVVGVNTLYRFFCFKLFLLVGRGSKRKKLAVASSFLVNTGIAVFCHVA